jgi:hypothetical protein
MQRWIALGAVVLAFFCVGSYFGLKTYKQTRPYPIWVPLPIKEDLDKSQRDEACARIRDHLFEEQRVLAMARDLELAALWSLPSEKEAAHELRKRMFVRLGRAPAEFGEVPAIEVGANGTRKEIETTERIVQRMVDDIKQATGGRGAGSTE